MGRSKSQKKVLILGAGVAWLACARTLSEKGIPYQLIEATDQIGGRIKTEITAVGFRLDRGLRGG